MSSARFLAIAPIMLVFGSISLLHCGTSDVVVADLSGLQADGGDAGGFGLGASCLNNTDCNEDSYCAYDSCDAANATPPALGKCAVRPTFCDDSPATVCGCDGVNYWNDCLRQFSGTTASAPGECPFPVSCGGNEKRPCPVTNALCAHLSHDVKDCGPNEGMNFGFCWVLPATCPPDSGQQWASCGPPLDGGPPDCLDTCDAIRSQTPHQPVLSCPPGP